MFDPLDKNTTKAEILLDRRRKITAITLIYEHVTQSVWRVFFWALFFAGIWLLQLPSIMGPWGETCALIIFLSVLAYFVKQDLWALSLPKKEDIDRRLEEDSHLIHRPLSLISEKLSNPKKIETRIIWSQRELTVLSAIKRLKLSFPRPYLAYKDPLAFRSIAILVFIIGIICAGSSWHQRLLYGLFPYSISWTQDKTEKVMIWIEPPEYTHFNQIILNQDTENDTILSVPQDSHIKVRVTGGLGTPKLVMGDVSLPMSLLGKKTYGVETKILDAELLEVKQSLLSLYKTQYQIRPNNLPQLLLEQGPTSIDKGQLQFLLKASDDYGVKDLYMNLRLSEIVEEKPLGTEQHDIRAVMSPPGKELELQPVYDLAWHPWAGLPVQIDLYVDDHTDLKSEFITLDLVLPERHFEHPTAQGLIAIRKDLAWNTHAASRAAAVELENLLNYPQTFQEDLVVFLSIRSMSSRLRYDADIATISAVISQLWDTALRIEEGNLSIAARNLREIQRRLEQALNDPNISDEELAEILQDMKEAMAEYFTELGREMQKRLEQGEAIPFIPNEMLSQGLSPDDLSSFLDQLQSEALNGSKDSAREMLSQLQRLMDTLNPSLSMQLPEDMQFMMSGINELQQLIEKQEELLGQTIDQAQKIEDTNQDYGTPIPYEKDIFENWGSGDMPPTPEPEQSDNKENSSQVDTQGHKVEQDALRYILGQLMLDAHEKLDEIPENMEEAEQAMRESANKLELNQPDLSIPHQEEALEHLRQSMDQMNQQLIARMESLRIMSLGNSSGQVDPLGRPFSEGENQGWWPGSKVKIPDEAEKKRIQEILKELREKSGQRDRPDYELEYYNRLLKQF